MKQQDLGRDSGETERVDREQGARLQFRADAERHSEFTVAEQVNIEPKSALRG